jgi:hypothetical protein
MTILLHMHSCFSENLYFTARSLTGRVVLYLTTAITRNAASKNRFITEYEYLNNEYLSNCHSVLF